MFVPVPVLPGRDGAREQALEWTRHDLDGLAVDVKIEFSDESAGTLRFP